MGFSAPTAAARDLLASLDAAGMVPTLDALHTTKKTARLITDELDAHYVLILKGNQPLTRGAAQALLAGPDAEWVETSAVEDTRGHGWTERRSIRTAPPTTHCSPAPVRPSACGAPLEPAVRLRSFSALFKARHGYVLPAHAVLFTVQRTKTGQGNGLSVGWWWGPKGGLIL
jgi:hypothetical protein